MVVSKRWFEFCPEIKVNKQQNQDAPKNIMTLHLQGPEVRCPRGKHGAAEDGSASESLVVCIRNPADGGLVSPS